MPTSECAIFLSAIMLLKEKINGDRATVNGFNLEVKYSPNPKYSLQLGGTAQNSYYENYFEPEDGITTNKILRTPQVSVC